jgi:hypothetical protein
MSNDWVKDIYEMHEKFGVHQWVKDQKDSGNFDKLHRFIEFRMKFLEEELKETIERGFQSQDPEELVDGCIDLCVVAIGTLDAFGIDVHKAWDSVHSSNMLKEVGVKEGRPNQLGLPDLIKPKMETHGRDWIAPSHLDNHGILNEVFERGSLLDILNDI